MHIDGDWFVEHIGNYYEYREGDRYIKQDGSTYVEQNGVFRKVLNGDCTFEHTGHLVENQVGDKLISQHGKKQEQVDNDVTNIYNGNHRLNVGKSYYESVEHDLNMNVGHNYNLGVVENCSFNIGGFFDMGLDSQLNFDIKDSVNIHSREGNIVLKTDGQFELMDNGVLTCEGFKNLGTKGNIEFISTFGNINMQCVKNDALANFNRKTTVIPWNPAFLQKVKSMVDAPVNITEAMLKGMNFTTDVNDIISFRKLMNDADELMIYDGLPVFFPTQMIAQNPNIPAPQNEQDTSWIPRFWSEATDWREIPEDVMWKIPSKVMGNINIETWTGDINIKTESTLGCAGNITIKASEEGGTITGYKIGTVKIENYGKERVYPDPRNLFFDSNFEAKKNGNWNLFIHGSSKENSGPALDASAQSLINAATGKNISFSFTGYNKFYDLYGEQTASFGNSNLSGIDIADSLNRLKKNGPPKMGCPMCIADYLMGIPGIQEIVYKNKDIIKIGGGRHEYGFQRFNPKDPENPRGTFNISTGDYDKISLGDAHAIDTGFMARDLASISIGGLVMSSNGTFSIDIGKNQYKKINSTRERGLVNDNYIHVDTPFDYNSPECLNEFIKKIGEDYNLQRRR